MSRHPLRSRSVQRAVRLVIGVIATVAVMFGPIVSAAPAVATAAPAAAIVDLARSSGPSASSGVVRSTLAGFTPGNLISDAVFTAKNSMTEAQIQAFFNSKVATCRGGVDWQGRPIVCLKDFKITSVNRPADGYCQGYTGAANETAARIIHRVAQSCGINPQVLIVMLQKEQGLVTHTWPDARRYDIALGQGCPDDAPCDPAFIGFFHQIYGAARQMQVYMEGKYFTWFAPGKTWNILYHPLEYIDGAWVNRCGSAPVYIANKATSAMYYYTPYQPNAAALAAGSGEAPCGAYGNRNFYNYFTDWFGSTQTPTGPSLASVNLSSYVVGIDSAGVMWGYPFSKGAWGDRRQLATGVGATTSAMIVGDLSGTGSRDVLLRQGSKLMVMRGSGAAYSNAQQLNVDWSGVALSTAAGDMDGDGVPDVLTTSGGGDLMLWRGDNRGGLLPGVRIGWGWAGMNLIIGDVDLNGDGNQDVLGRDAAGRLWIFHGDGVGGWSGQAQLGQGWSGMSTIFSAGDFTGDRVDDILARTTNGDLWLYPGNGTGGITAYGKIGNGWQTLRAVAGSSDAVTMPRALPAGAGDVDKDLASDVLAITSNGNLNLYRGNGAGGWRGSQQIGTGWGEDDRMLTLGDFNGDGHKDLGRITAAGLFLLYPGQASGSYGVPIQIGNGWQSISLVVGGLDYDGDRNADVIGRNAAGHLVLYRGNGRGGWADGGSPIGYGWSGFNAVLNVGDFDGDGQADLLTRTADANLWLYPTNGHGGWGTPRQIGYGWGGLNSIFSPGDFDGNGTADVLARTSSGDLHLFRGDGSGGWSGSGVIGWGWGGFTGLG